MVRLKPPTSASAVHAREITKNVRRAKKPAWFLRFLFEYFRDVLSRLEEPERAWKRRSRPSWRSPFLHLLLSHCRNSNEGAGVSSKDVSFQASSQRKITAYF